jgi:diguanylate cyclase (GGDEF)-like protein
MPAAASMLRHQAVAGPKDLSCSQAQTGRQVRLLWGRYQAVTTLGSRRGGDRARRAVRPVRGSRLVASAVVQILIVVLLLVSVLVVVSRNASTASRASRRANALSGVSADLEAVSNANVELESVFERAASIQDLGTRVAQFSTANATGIQGTGAFSTYVQRSLLLPRELVARGAYQRATNAWDALAATFGAKLVSAATSTATITQTMDTLRQLQAAREARLSELRGLYVTAAARDETLVAHAQDDLSRQAAWGIVLAVVLGLGLMVVAARRASLRTKERVRVEGVREATERRTDFESRVQRSMALAIDEPAVVDSVAHAIDVVAYASAEFLVDQSDGGDFVRMIAPKAGDGCGVERGSDCPAVRLRQRIDFPDSNAIDACPFLRARHEQVSQCVCVPVTIADQTLAVLRADAPSDQSLTAEASDWIAILARNAGERISALRAFANSQLQAATDPLTGLANRRTLEHAIDTRLATGSYSVIFADIDHFKDLNDTFGHEVGDDCLQAFARVLGRATRPGDLCARYGGEEFVVLLPGTNGEDAALIADRVRVFLAEEVRSAHLAPFTVSIGVASTEHASDVEEIIHAADHAMFDAKGAGRNRTVAAVV